MNLASAFLYYVWRDENVKNSVRLSLYQVGSESTALRQINKHEINSTIVIKKINLTCKLQEDYKYIHAFLFARAHYIYLYAIHAFLFVSTDYIYLYACACMYKI